MKFCAFFLVVVGVCSGPVSGAPVPVTGSMTYTQDFNSLGTASRSWADDSILPGWYAQANNGATALGTIQAGNGTTGQNGLLNLGTAGSTERTLGTKATGTGNLANMALAVQFRNTSADPIRVSRIVYTGELWRTNDLPASQAESFTVYYVVSPTKITDIVSGANSPVPDAGGEFTALGAGADWSSPNNLPTGSALDGNAAGNRTTVSFVPPPLTINPGEYFVVKWTDANLASNDGHQGLDDVSVEFTSLAGVPGTVDPEFRADANGVISMLQQPDGRIVMAGQFNHAGGEDRDAMARVHPDGTPDPSFIASDVNSPFCFALQNDGTFIVGEDYLNRNIDKLNPDGTPANSFSATTNDIVYGVISQADGKIVISGSFTTVRGVVRNRVARLNADSTLDTAFNPDADGRVFAMTPQADGKIVIGGQFTTVSGVSRARIARLNANGTVDASFNAGTLGGSNPFVYSIAIQPDGKVLIGGLFTSVSGVTRNHMARLNAGGLLDANFNPNVNDNVVTMVLQCDGKILIGGDFTFVGGIYHFGAARLHTSGALDSAFSADVSFNGVRSLWSQSDGRILVTGGFSKISGVERDGTARLLNDPATQSLAATSPGRVQWLRGGTAPEAAGVSFELTTSGGSAWMALGPGTRTAGGWQLTGLALPPAGLIRGRTRLTGSYLNASSAPYEMVSAFAFPEIAVEQPSGTSLTDGATVHFGPVNPGGEATLTFTIRNSGPGDLTGISASIDGADAGSFTVSSAPPGTVPAAGGSATFSVNFAPAGSGSRTAALHIASNDGDESPFNLTLTGTVLSELEAWRQSFFGTTSNTGAAANNADPDHDGLENLIEFAFGFPPDSPSLKVLPGWSWQDDDFVMTFTSLVSGVTYIAEYSADLSAGNWTALPNSAMPPQHLYFAPGVYQKLFMRVRVTVP